MIDVDEVEAGGFLAKLDLAGAGIADLDFFPLQDVGLARLYGLGWRVAWPRFNALGAQKKSPASA